MRPIDSGRSRQPFLELTEDNLGSTEGALLGEGQVQPIWGLD